MRFLATGDCAHLIDLAWAVAYEAHEGQTRRDGSKYLAHVERVAQEHSGDQEIIAILHDVVEDSPINILDLKERGFSERVIRAVDALTRRKDETYGNYVLRIMMAGEDAIAVKISDIRDNLSSLEETKTDKRDKYQLALLALKERLCRLDDITQEKQGSNLSQIGGSEP